MENDNKNQKDTILDDVRQAGEISKSIGKLLKDRVLVQFNTNQSEIDSLESDEFVLKSKLNELKDESDKELKDSLRKALDEIHSRQEELSKTTTKAYLVPLKYRDMRTVQTAITEAMFAVEGMNFDTDVKILMIMKEKKLMTIYLSLRKYGNVNERYFSSLEELVKISDRTIEELHDEYIKELLLTDEERKNS